MSIKYTSVLINLVNDDDYEWYSMHVDSDDLVCLDRAVKKHFGKNAFFSISTSFTNENILCGYIYKYHRNNLTSPSAITDLVSIQFSYS